MNLPFHHEAHQKVFENARFLKKVMTPAEETLWQHLRDRKFKGYKFRRQHPLKSFIADFYCHTSKLIIEVDGGYHQAPEIKEYDHMRTKELEALGLKVIRFSNEQVLNEMESVFIEISRNLTPTK